MFLQAAPFQDSKENLIMKTTHNIGVVRTEQLSLAHSTGDGEDGAAERAHSPGIVFRFLHCSSFGHTSAGY